MEDGSAWVDSHSMNHFESEKILFKSLCSQFNSIRLYTEKDTRHRERLSKGVEGRAPRDLPGSDVCQDELQFQQEVVSLQGKTALSTGDQTGSQTDHTNLVEEDGHEKEINAEGFGRRAVVVFEEESGEDDDEVLARRITERASEHLQAAHHDDECGQAGRGNGSGQRSKEGRMSDGLTRCRICF